MGNSRELRSSVRYLVRLVVHLYSQLQDMIGVELHLKFSLTHRKKAGQ